MMLGIKQAEKFELSFMTLCPFNGIQHAIFQKGKVIEDQHVFGKEKRKIRFPT